MEVRISSLQGLKSSEPGNLASTSLPQPGARKEDYLRNAKDCHTYNMYIYIYIKNYLYNIYIYI